MSSNEENESMDKIIINSLIKHIDRAIELNMDWAKYMRYIQFKVEMKEDIYKILKNI